MAMKPALRWALAAAAALVFLLLLVLSLVLTDLLLRVWDRLSHTPPWVFYTWLTVFLALVGAGIWLIVRLLHPPRQALAPTASPLTESELDERLQQAAERGVDVDTARAELAELGRRREAGSLYVALFGEVSVGKSSLIRALVPDAEAEVGVEAGVTRDVRHYRWRSPEGDELVLADVPGTGEVGGELETLAREEAQRAQLVVFVAEGDLTHSEHQALTALAELHKPLVLAVNKQDRYDAGELETIVARIRERLREAGVPAPVVTVSAGGVREVVRELPDGGEARETRALVPQVEGLRKALTRAVESDAGLFDRLRDGAIFALAAHKLEQAELGWRREQADKLIRKTSRKAALAALATVAPGADVLVQGYLGTGLVRGLCELYGVPVQEIDVEQLLKLLQTRLGRVTPLVLSVVGNGLKAFPGLGTVVGGVVQAVAYGLIFDALGRAVARTLERRGALSQGAVEQSFKEVLGEDMEARARGLAAWLVETRGRHGD
jgi:GTP-binding protein EngB required for normal cell division/uncharacterized protein (DUF697 family)